MTEKPITDPITEQVTEPEIQRAYGKTPEPEAYRGWLTGKPPAHSSIQFAEGEQGSGNLQYIVATGDGDLSLGIGLPLSISPEERAYQLLKDWMPKLMHEYEGSSIRLFFKHTLQSLMGTHFVFGLEYKGFEVEEHSFVVHLDRQNQVVMVCCTYLPDLPNLLKIAEQDPFPEEISLRDAIASEIKNLRENDQVDAEKLWLLIWNKDIPAYEAVPGSQVKVSGQTRKSQAEKPADVLGITGSRETKKIHNSPGLPERKLGLGAVNREFVEEDDDIQAVLGDDRMRQQKRPGMLLDLESTSDLVGRYAAIKDQIEVFHREMKGIFTNETESLFDRVNAYYHIDYIQRYFRDRLGLHLLDNYSHLNPVRLVLARRSDDVSRYDVNGQQILFYQLGNRPFTAVRDARVVYHEFVHVVTDAIARLHRAGRLINPRASEALQAQAMDEGLADYFACSLAVQQGAKKALFYYRANRKWVVRRDLDPEGVQQPVQEQVDLQELGSESAWNQKKYSLGQLWGRYLWKLRKDLGAELADMLVVHSLFFLTRWATFVQGQDAIRLADQLLFGSSHEKVIVDKYEEVMSGIRFRSIPFPTLRQPEGQSAV